MTMDDSFAGDGSITLRCEECGSNIVPPPDETPDETVIACSTCGAKGESWGDIKAAIHEAVAQKASESAADIFGKAFEGLDGITFKKG